MIRLFFDIAGQFRRYTTKKYTVVKEANGNFYQFIDEFDGRMRKLPEQYYRGEEQI